MTEIKNSSNRKNTTFSMNETLRERFYHTLIKRFGCTRNHVGESIDEAVEDWINKVEKELEKKGETS